MTLEWSSAQCHGGQGFSDTPRRPPCLAAPASRLRRAHKLSKGSLWEGPLPGRIGPPVPTTVVLFPGSDQSQSLLELWVSNKGSRPNSAESPPVLRPISARGVSPRRAQTPWPPEFSHPCQARDLKLLERSVGRPSRCRVLPRELPQLPDTA